ncbi:hypothetical protein KM043_000168 [Ampulex compressa]|nr:hypothetical protein KM043_000168 [Ampulex compressa]
MGIRFHAESIVIRGILDAYLNGRLRESDPRQYARVPEIAGWWQWRIRRKTCPPSSFRELESRIRCSLGRADDGDSDGGAQAQPEGFKKPTSSLLSKHGIAKRFRPLPSAKATEDSAWSEDATDRGTEEVLSGTAGPEGNPPELESSCTPADVPKSVPLRYEEPSWAGKPDKKYAVEVLKSGVILETVDLSGKSFHAIGRLPCCDLSLAHPTISRYHAVLQYRSIEDATNAKGLYVFDLASTYGTFWNGRRIRPNTYVRLHAGHILKFGCSQRKYILQAPPEDLEEESEYTVTELKERRRLEMQLRLASQDNGRLAESEKEPGEEEERNAGIDWGMGEDADETTDLEENPYAVNTEEELFLDDPKKTLRGWFEREGYELQYQVEEKGVGQFLCWITLPIDASAGRTVKAEALVKGKKKESVIQCALEACRILDKHGLLRQAHHDSRKRKTRNWEEEDFYDSEEDNFLDRTGAIEKKREQRMKLAGKLEEKVETYDSLLPQLEDARKRISTLSESIKSAEGKSDADREQETEEDALDAFMSNLNASTLTKKDIMTMKRDLQELQKEEARLAKLVNLAKPVDLPALGRRATPPSEAAPSKKKEEPGIEDEACKESGSREASVGARKFTMRAAKEEKADESDKAESRLTQGGRQESRPLLCSRKVRSSRDRAEEEDGEEGRSLPAGTSGRQEHRDRDATEASKYRKTSQKRAAIEDKRLEEICDQELHGENYSTWVPPQDQSGDGKTSLNEKYGY